MSSPEPAPRGGTPDEPIRRRTKPLVTRPSEPDPGRTETKPSRPDPSRTPQGTRKPPPMALGRPHGDTDGKPSPRSRTRPHRPSGSAPGIGPRPTPRKRVDSPHRDDQSYPGPTPRHRNQPVTPERIGASPASVPPENDIDANRRIGRQIGPGFRVGQPIGDAGRAVARRQSIPPRKYSNQTGKRGGNSKQFSSFHMYTPIVIR